MYCKFLNHSKANCRDYLKIPRICDKTAHFVYVGDL